MKSILLLAIPLTMTACISTPAYDREQAYAKCESIKTVTIRDRCISDAIATAARERQELASETKQREEEAEQREVDRIIAGAEND